MFPRPNKPYIASVVAIGTSALAFIGGAFTSQVYREWSRGLPIGGGFSWPKVIGIDLACLGCAVSLYWKIYADSKTIMDASGIARPSLNGQRFIAWSDVTKITVFRGVGFHIHAGASKIVLSPYAYHEPKRVIEELQRYVSSTRQAHD